MLLGAIVMGIAIYLLAGVVAHAASSELNILTGNAIVPAASAAERIQAHRGHTTIHTHIAGLKTPNTVIPTRPAAGRAGNSSPRQGTQGTHRGLLGTLLHEIKLALVVLGIGVGGLLLGALAFLPSRTRARRRRTAQRERYEIIPYRNDVATPERMVQVFQALAATFNRRWFRRLLDGVPSLAFEIHILPQRDRPARVVLTVVCAPEDVLRVDGCLQAAYPDVRVGYEFSLNVERAADAPIWTGHVKRLKKRRAFITRVAAADLERVGSQPFDHQMIDGLLANLAHISAPVTVQLSLTPAPRWVERLAQRAYRDEERRLAAGQLSGELGERSPRATADLRGGLTVQYHLLFYFDIRCASSDAKTALLAANSLSQGVGENKLTLKEPFLLGALYGKRIEKAIPRLVPPIRHGVLSSGELAALWQLPTNRVKSVMIKRSNQLREPASPAVWRPTNPEDAFAEDEHGPVGIRPADRKFGVALTGVPGVGKTSAMVGLWKCDAHDRDAVLIGLDPKTEAAEEMLAHVPPDRTVYWLDLARPEFGMNPLMMRAGMEVIGDTVVESLRDINEEGAIMAASDRYLRVCYLRCAPARPKPAEDALMV